MNGKKMCILKVRCRKKMKFGKPLASRGWAWVRKGDKSAAKKPHLRIFRWNYEKRICKGKNTRKVAHPAGQSCISLPSKPCTPSEFPLPTPFL